MIGLCSYLRINGQDYLLIFIGQLCITSSKKSALTSVPVECELWSLEFAQKPREEATGIFLSVELILTQQEDQKVFANGLLQLG